MKRAPKIEKMAGGYLECTTETFLNNIFNACFKNVKLHYTSPILMNRFSTGVKVIARVSINK